MANLGPTTIFGDLIINGSIGGAVRVAYVKTTPTTGEYVNVYLDNNDTGEEVQVRCIITDGDHLNTAEPPLTDGVMMFVAKINDVWYCMSLFHAV